MSWTTKRPYGAPRKPTSEVTRLTMRHREGDEAHRRGYFAHQKDGPELATSLTISDSVYARAKISFVTHDEQKSLRCMRSYGCVCVSHPSAHVIA
jgi:hypothetical protein